MNGIRKNTRIGLVVAAVGFLGLAACTTDPVSSGDTEYEEIRIDAFSHYWQTQKLNGFVNGNRLVFTGSVSEGTYADTTILLDLTLDKTADLPDHDIDTNGQIIYKSSREPKVFTCYLYNNGMYVEWSEDTVSDPVMRSHSTFDDGIEEVGQQRWLKVYEVPESMESMPCGFSPGQGFYLGRRNSDYFGFEPNYLGSEIVIRY